MSSYAVKCPVTQLVDFVDKPGNHKCRDCGATHEAYECGAPGVTKGVPAVATFKEVYSDLHKQPITSRVQEEKLDADKGIVRLTDREYDDFCPKPDKKFGKRRVRYNTRRRNAMGRTA